MACSHCEKFGDPLLTSMWNLMLALQCTRELLTLHMHRDYGSNSELYDNATENICQC